MFEEVFNVYNNEQKVTNQVSNIIQVFVCVIFTVINSYNIAQKYYIVRLKAVAHKIMEIINIYEIAENSSLGM